MPEDLGLRVTWLGHSTVLLEMGGVRILTDPFLRDRLGPLRRRGPSPDVAGLGAIDLVLVSHAHPDHFDRASLLMLRGDPLVIVPSGLGKASADLGLRSWELRIGEHITAAGLEITAIPARHGRWPRHRTAATIGFLVRGRSSVYVAGDTSRFEAMATLVQGVDLALLPIGSWGPHRAPWHLGPAGAARVAREIGARAVIPVHWGTLYPVGLQRIWAAPLARPAVEFERVAARVAPAVEVRILQPGESTTFELVEPT